MEFCLFLLRFAVVFHKFSTLSSISPDTRGESLVDVYWYRNIQTEIP